MQTLPTKPTTPNVVAQRPAEPAHPGQIVFGSRGVVVPRDETEAIKRYSIREAASVQRFRYVALAVVSLTTAVLGIVLKAC